MKRLLLFAVLSFAAWKGYEHYRAPAPVVADAMSHGGEQAVQAEGGAAPGARYRCDGRTHCSQMTSRAEAEYFVRHCPNTKMDGDRDGEPCENDSRF